MTIATSKRTVRRLRAAALVALAALTCGAIASTYARRAEAKSAKLPHVVALARADAAKRKHVSLGKVRVVKVTAKTWPNSCLGLGKRDVEQPTTKRRPSGGVKRRSSPFPLDQQHAVDVVTKVQIPHIVQASDE